MIKAIFFDAGGVLVRTGGPNPLIGAAKIMGISSAGLKPVFRKMLRRVAEGKTTEAAFWRMLVRRYRVPAGGSPRLSRLFQKRWAKPKPRVRAIARTLSRNGYTVGILSDVIPSDARRNRRVGIYKGFHPVLLSHEIGAMKHRERAFAVAARQARVRFREMVFLDDRQVHVDTAKSLGIKAFVYKNPGQLVRQLRRFGVKI